jgi:ubiquinone/menaquinone biosynthesis C-methylase UbiE
MNIISNLLNQARKPTGWFGRFNLWTFNIHHSKLTDWGLEHVSIGTSDTVLDVGCGGGLTVSKLAAIATEGKIYGVDISEESVAASRRTNKQWIQKGRVDIREASVSHLPFSDVMFDLVTAVETIPFWPDLAADMREVLRVLKPGGKFIFILEAFKDGKLDNRFQKVTALVHAYFLSVQEYRELLLKVGYADAQTFEQNEKGWMCEVGTKAA